MLHRITVMLIIGFWAAMTGLLVVREVYPESTKLNDIPVAHVGRLLFQHEQASDLVIREKQRDVGYFHFQPRTNQETGARSLDFHGNVGLNVIGAGRQRISWVGSIKLDHAFNMTHLRLTLSTLEPVQQLELDLDPQTNVANFNILLQGTEIEKGSFTMDQKGVAGLLERAGLPDGLFQQLISKQSEMPAPEITARQASLKINGETISTYAVTIAVAGQTLLDGHITQLGQMLKATAPALGYKFVPHNSRDIE